MNGTEPTQAPVGAPAPPATPAEGRSTGTTILIAVLAAAAGAVAVRVLDRTIFNKDRERERTLEEELDECRAEKAAIQVAPVRRALPAARPLPPPLTQAELHDRAMARILGGRPRARVSDDFWAKLSGQGEDEYDFED